MDFTPKIVLLSVSIEKEKQELQKQIDNYNLLISENMSFIKDKQKELAKNRKEVKQLTNYMNLFKRIRLY
jgi:peptidoglycan hydrolase CwlO-like protein